MWQQVGSFVYKRHVQVSKGGHTILTGYMEPATKLWRFPNASKPQPSMPKGEPQINAVLPDGTMKDTITFLHWSMGSPTTRTILKAIGNKNLPTWTFMTESNVHKFLPHPIPTQLGHKDKTSKNPQSTTPQSTTGDKKNNWKQSTYKQQSTSQKFHQEQYTLIKLADFPPNQAVVTNTWWSSTHMTQTPFL